MSDDDELQRAVEAAEAEVAAVEAALARAQEAREALTAEQLASLQARRDELAAELQGLEQDTARLEARRAELRAALDRVPWQLPGPLRLAIAAAAFAVYVGSAVAGYRWVGSPGLMSRTSSNPLPPASTSRALRQRLETAQARRRELEASLREVAPSTPLPLPERVEELKRLAFELDQLLPKVAAALARREAAQQACDGAQKVLLRREALPRAPPALVSAALGLGFLGGAAACVAWLARWPSHPRFAAACGLVVSAAFLLRAAWRVGRVSGARRT